MKHAFSAVFRLNLLIIFTLFPVALRAQALHLSTKNTFAMHEESNFPLEIRGGMSFVSVRLNGTRPLSSRHRSCRTVSARSVHWRPLEDNSQYVIGRIKFVRAHAFASSL